VRVADAPIASAPAVAPPASPAPAPIAPAETAQKPFVPAFTAQILKAEPAIGQLPTGATVLVDDGTCPAGQIKQIVGGNITTGQPRLRSCISRPVDAPAAATPSTPTGALTGQALDAAALDRMRPYVGNAVEGISTVTGKPFVMTLKAGGVADVKIEFANGGFSTDHGNWWIEPNGHFCIRYTRFAGGNLVCRELVVEGGATKAYTWDHRPNPWVIKK
jgi:hypothetical protein